MSQDIIQNLYASMPDRIASCIRARGGSTGNKRQTTSRSVQIKNKKPYVPHKKHAWRVLPTSQKDPREDDGCAACRTKAIQVHTEWMCCICKVPLCLGKENMMFPELSCYL
ncbi:hypothetical protein TNCV_1899981 [Trichonephila clavipes]|nr:hypothetical protein TNCV_1899981 [Trichonephila clavipes]